MKTSNKIDRARARRVRRFLHDAGSSFVGVHYVKVDGSEARMTVNPRARVGIKGTGSATAKRAAANNPGLVRLFNVHKGEWRSVYVQRVRALECNGATIILD